MATEVLLMCDVPELGAEGEVVRVSAGYARNFLFPKKLAAPVSEATRRRLLKLQKEREEARRLQLAQARELAARLAQVSCTIAVKAGSNEKLYGSVSAADIAGALKEQGIVLDKQCIHLAEPIKTLGVFETPVKLHPEVETTVKVWVVEE